MPVPADVLFDYLSDVEHLPEYFPMITSARATGGAVQTTAVIEPPGQEKQKVEGEAWFTVADGERRLTWGSEGDNDYHGEISVEPDGDGSAVTFSLHTEADHDGIDDGIDDTLDRIGELSARGVPRE
jgi:carbon monoxide dehydrogenase subunit G